MIFVLRKSYSKPFVFEMQVSAKFLDVINRIPKRTQHTLRCNVKKRIFWTTEEAGSRYQNKEIYNFTAKYFIFCNMYQKAIPVWEGFKLYIRNKIRIEQEIALIKDNF